MRTPLTVLLAGCTAGAPDPGDTDVADTDLDQVTGQPPTIDLFVPGGPVTDRAEIRGEVGDPDQDGATLLVELESSIDGPLLQFYPQEDSTWTWEGALSVGQHQIRATVTDADENQGIATAPLEVIPTNHAPGCGITTPQNGATYAHGTTIAFSGWYDDPDQDAVRLLWTSSVSGALFQGTTYSRILEDGDHEITVSGDDYHGGTCSASVSIHVGG